MVHVYDIGGRKVAAYRTLNLAIANLARRPGYFSTWDDHSGDRHRRRGGVWELLDRGEPAPKARLPYKEDEA